jgi:hypothetical protein
MREATAQPLEAKMRRLGVQLRAPQAEASKLDDLIAANLQDLGFGA